MTFIIKENILPIFSEFFGILYFCCGFFCYCCGFFCSFCSDISLFTRFFRILARFVCAISRLIFGFLCLFLCLFSYFCGFFSYICRYCRILSGFLSPFFYLVVQHFFRKRANRPQIFRFFIAFIVFSSRRELCDLVFETRIHVGYIYFFVYEKMIIYDHSQPVHPEEKFRIEAVLSFVIACCAKLPSLTERKLFHKQLFSDPCNVFAHQLVVFAGLALLPIEGEYMQFRNFVRFDIFFMFFENVILLQTVVVFYLYPEEFRYRLVFSAGRIAPEQKTRMHYVDMQRILTVETFLSFCPQEDYQIFLAVLSVMIRNAVSKYYAVFGDRGEYVYLAVALPGSQPRSRAVYLIAEAESDDTDSDQSRQHGGARVSYSAPALVIIVISKSFERKPSYRLIQRIIHCRDSLPPVFR